MRRRVWIVLMSLTFGATAWALPSAASTKPKPIPTLHSPSGNLYRAGEFCPARDLGVVDHGSDGLIKCELVRGYHRWTKD
jgi:hypothetical protein